MPLYESEEYTRDKLWELRLQNRCQVCHGHLAVFMDVDKGKGFLACWDWLRTHHEGIEREAAPPFEPNIPTWRKDMVEELGEKKTAALQKYVGVVSLTKLQAMEVLRTIWPKAPATEVIKAAMICAQYGLNPLNKHIFLIPFNEDKPNEEWVTVWGIKAKRLVASRSGPFSYIDNTPRKMTEQEQKEIFGEVYTDRIWCITQLRDPATGAEAPGYGFWLNEDTPKGLKKGNTKFNMACIRSESQALDRLRPGEMPQGIEAVDENTIEGDFTLVRPGGDEKGDEPGNQTREEGGKAQAPLSSPKGKNKKAAAAPGATIAGETAPASPDSITKDNVPDLTALQMLCNKFWNMQPTDVWRELGYKTQSDVTEPAWDCWLKIKALKTAK